MGRKVRGLVLILLFLLAGLGTFGFEPLGARQRVLPNAGDVRFELLGNEPIAGPDGRALVSDWTVLMFRDRRSDRCYVAFKHGDSIAVEEAVCASRP